MTHTKPVLVLAIAAAIAMLLRGPVLAAGKPAGDSYLWLHVSGTTIRTSATAANPLSVFVPIGAAYVPGPGGLVSGDYKKYEDWFKAHGCNCFRLVMSIMTRDKSTPYASDAEFLQALNNYWDPMIRYASKVGLYVVIDDHEFMNPPPANKDPGAGFFQTSFNYATYRISGPTYGPPVSVSTWQKRWGIVARKYADDPTVMGYELMNEPHDWQYANGTPFNSIGVLRHNLLGAITEVRKYDKRHIIFLASNEWEQSKALELTWGDYLDTHGNPDPMKNLIFAFHEYPWVYPSGNDDVPVVQANITSFMAKHHVPVICTEFGTQFESGITKFSVEQNKDWQIEFLADLSSLKVGWLIWCSGGVDWNRLWDYQDVWIPVAERNASPMPLPASLP